MKRAALLTPPGRGAVATVAIDASGAAAVKQLPWRGATRTSMADIPPDAISFGHWGSEIAEEVVVGRVGAARWEVHCHGGVAASARILEDLRAAGFTILTGFVWITHHEGLLSAEWADALSRATTARTAGLLLEQSQGLLRRAAERWLASTDCRSIAVELASIARWSSFGLHLTQPWQVAIAGLPNAGKSSLLNRLLGYTRSIVDQQPGTTRDVVTASAAISGWPVEFADTAGLREAGDAIEAEGVRRAQSQAAEADLLLYVVDRSVGITTADRTVLEAHPQCMRVLQKSDLPAARADDGESWLAVSARSGEGIERLLEEIADRLVPELPPAGTPIAVTDRQSCVLQQSLSAAKRDDRESCHLALHHLLQGERGA